MQTAGAVTDSLSPVMTFQVATDWFAVPVEKMDRIALASRLWSVPFSWPQHLGLMDDNDELVPVLRLKPSPIPRPGASEEPDQLVAILKVRGESVGLAIDNAGQIHSAYQRVTSPTVPAGLKCTPTAARTQTMNDVFWLIDPDELWQQDGDVIDSSTPNI